MSISWGGIIDFVDHRGAMHCSWHKGEGEELPARRSNQLVMSLLGFSFFLSGVSALLYQIVWQRALMRLAGASTTSLAIVLAGVMAGLAAGAILGGAAFRRARSAAYGYAALELLIGASGLTFSLISGQSHFSSWFSFQSMSAGQAHQLRLAVASLIVALPAVLMGMTLPAVITAAQDEDGNEKSGAGLLYALNLAGAFLGGTAGGFCIIPSFGLNNSLLTAAALNFLSACLAVGTAGRLRPGSNFDGPSSVFEAGEAADERIEAPDAVLLNCALVVSAVVSMMLEIVWARLFTLVLGSSTYSVA
ncbi:MAG TPA: fused MFS/spermidine synthase, partial [Candidatus Obscuribacterales bacterium]